MPLPVTAIVTVPPYATFLEEAARHPLVSGFRLNTVMPLKETPREVLARLSKLGQPLWVDLKGRQLRVVTPAIPPFTEVKLSHKIKVKTPVDAYFSDGNERVRVAAVDGDRLIMEDGPRRMVGPGESVNIIDPSLEIEGTLTDTDKAYLAAMKDLGLAKVMLSYVESPEDAQEVRDQVRERIEIFAPEVSKSGAAAWLAASCGIAREEVCAVGNDYNDEDLLSWAGRAYVVGNAPPALRSRFVTVADNDHGGVAEAAARWLAGD